LAAVSLAVFAVVDTVNVPPGAFAVLFSAISCFKKKVRSVIIPLRMASGLETHFFLVTLE
jgi:hypothetical protein